MNDCDNCQNKYLDYGYFCVDCDPFDPENSNHEHFHLTEEKESDTLRKNVRERKSKCHQLKEYFSES